MSRTVRRRIDPTQVDKILLIRLRRMGDVLMTTPAVSALRRGFPRAFIAYVVEEPFRQLVEGNPALDRVIVLPRRMSRRRFVSEALQIRAHRFDVAVDFHGGPRASLLTLLSGARLKVGYRIKYKRLVYDIRIPRSRGEERVHSVEGHLDLVRALGIEADESSPLFMPTAEGAEAEEVRRALEQNGLQEGQSIVLHIGAGNRCRDWGLDNLRRLARMMDDSFGGGVVLVGGPEDREREIAMKGAEALPWLSLVGALSLRQLHYLLSRASVFVGPDGGPMHMAAAAGAPIVALFGPGLPANFSPWRAEALLIEKDLDCRPCRQKTCVHHDFRCLREITPEEVLAAVLKIRREPPQP